MISEERTNLATWGLAPIRPNGPICIAGPCAAETEEQVMEAARALRSIGISAFRAGVWKPRTRPGAFEGIGETALQWLHNVKTETGLATATEIASPKHLEAALNAGIDILWIGARTTPNPFLIQEIANALKGTNTPVFVKNPIAPDLNLWIGAIERFLGAGLPKVGAILRGFGTLVPGELRNDPGWQLAIDLRAKFPGLPILCDPSHIAGRRDKLLTLSQQALDFDCDGLMLESHCHPECALSDARQQLLPQDLDALLHALRVPTRGIHDARFAALRSQIDELDSELLGTIARRMQVVAELGTLKRDQNLTLLQQDRWNQVLSSMLQRGKELGLAPDFVTSLANLLHQKALENQQKLLDDNP